MIDSHIHLQDLSSEKREAVLSCLCEGGPSTVFCNGTSPKDWHLILSLASQSGAVKPFIGVHPWYVDDLPEDWEARFGHGLSHGQCGVGEIGLDKGPRGGNFEKQKTVFVRQLDTAVMLKKVFVIHCVQAWGPLMQILRAHSLKGFVFIVHSFIGSTEILSELLGMGAMISISQRSLNQKNTFEVMAMIPENRLLLETDFPYLPGLEKDQVGVEDYRQAIQEVYNRTAELRGVSAQDILSCMTENAKKVLQHI